MAWFLSLVAIAVSAILLILFLNRYYRKATREVSVVRTGAGGQKVVLDGGCIALPFLHKVAEVNMRTTRLEIERSGAKSVITRDRLRVDVSAEFYVRVRASVEAVATAAQALAGKSFRANELAEILEGKLVDAMLSVAARYTMDELQDNRGEYAREVSALLADNLAQNGLMLESVSITRIDQTPFHALDENNAFNSVGMRRLAEIVAVNKKERAAIEAASEVAVRQSLLDATKRKLSIAQEEEEATIAQRHAIEIARSRSQAETAEEQAGSEKRREAARIAREREVRLAEIDRDRELRRSTLASELEVEIRRIENEVAQAGARVDAARAHAAAIAAKAEEARAEEMVLTTRETAAAERDKALALIRAAEQAEVDDTRARSEAETIVMMSQAEAKATLERAEAQKTRLVAEAEGRAAVIAAENSQTPALIALRLEEARLGALPEVVERIMKPAEKIETIRINHIGGFGGAGGGAGAPSGERSAVNQVVESVLSMALQLPAVQKLGEDVGIMVGDGIGGVTRALGSPSSGNGSRKDASPQPDGPAAGES